MAKFEDRFNKKFDIALREPSIAIPNVSNELKSFIKSELLALLDRVEKIIGEDEIGQTISGLLETRNDLRTQQRAKLKELRKSI